MKKTFKYLAIALAAYFIIGLILVRLEVIQNLYFFPGYKIQYGGGSGPDDSTFGTDGPIIVYQDEKVLSYAIVTESNGLKVQTNEINRKDTLSCFVAGTKQSFNFCLKDSLVIAPSEYTLPEKMLVISDIEGNFKGFHTILKGAGIINDHFEWIFGNGHLVLAGDFFDRGTSVTECLWLVYKLEAAAEKQGGKVHFILGNHEMMNLKGQYKYLPDKYLYNADSLKLVYGNWYDRNTELGRWLRTKNGIEKIGSFLIVHAGISKNLHSYKYSIPEINTHIREAIDQTFDKKAMGDNIFIGKDSPLWYRGISLEEESDEDVTNTLKAFNADKMIIGHTIQNHVRYLYDGKVIAIDLDHKENSDKGKMYALWFEQNIFYSIDNNGNKKQLE